MEYNHVRRLLKRLFSKRRLVPAMALTTSIIGREAALVRIKSSSHSSLEKLAQFSLSCNHVLAYMEINSGKEAMMVISAGNKRELVKFLELVRSLINSDVVEISAEYGILPSEFQVLLKNSCFKCNYSTICNNNVNPVLFKNNRNTHTPR